MDDNPILEPSPSSVPDYIPSFDLCAVSVPSPSVVLDLDLPSQSIPNTTNLIPEPGPSHILDSCPDCISNPSTHSSLILDSVPGSSYDNLSQRQKHRARKRLQDLLDKESPRKLVSIFASTVEVGGKKLKKIFLKI